MVRSPRFLRPHTIIVRNHVGESEDGEEQLIDTTVGRVKFDGTYGITQSSRGITSSDTVVVVIDMHDYQSDKTYSKKLTNPSTQFTFATNDLIVYEGDTFTINQVKEISPRGTDPDFVEVYAS